MRFVSKVIFLFICENRFEIIQKMWGHSKGVEGIWLCRNSIKFIRQDKVQTRDFSQAEITRVTKQTGWWRQSGDYRNVRQTRKITHTNYQVTFRYGLWWDEIMWLYISTKKKVIKIIWIVKNQAKYKQKVTKRSDIWHIYIRKENQINRQITITVNQWV